jgi:hypothetical protein
MKSPVVYTSIDDAIVSNFPFKNREILDSIVREVRDRVGNVYLGLFDKYIVEADYIDDSWRHLYSAHYSKTYYKECTNLSIRLHCFSGNIDQDGYYGYMIFRPLPCKVALAKIVLRPIADIYGEIDVYLMLSNIEVNLFGYGLKFFLDVWPLFIQDRVAQVCADASMNMVAYFLSKNHKADFPNYHTNGLFLGNGELLFSRPVPSSGLSIYEISSILSKKGYRPYLRLLKNNNDDSPDTVLKKKKDFLGFIDSQIESRLPILLAFDRHVIVIAGHVGIGREKKYIVFDDSGYCLKKSGIRKATSFTDSIDLGDLLDEIRYIYAISFEYDRLFYRYDDLCHYLMKNSELKHSLALLRTILVEYKTLLVYFRENCVSYDIVHDRYPRYVWWVEEIGLVIDAASHRQDHTYNVVAIVQESYDSANVKKISNLSKIKGVIYGDAGEKY